MIKYLLLSLLLLTICAVPAVGLAEDGSLRFPCTTYDTCTFGKIFGINSSGDSLFSRIYRFLTLYLAVPLATISIVVGGVMYATSSVKPANREAGKKILTYAVVGLIIVLSSWLIVQTIVNSLASDNDVGSYIQLK